MFHGLLLVESMTGLNNSEQEVALETYNYVSILNAVSHDKLTISLLTINCKCIQLEVAINEFTSSSETASRKIEILLEGENNAKLV